MNREEIFKRELNYISDERIRKACLEMLKLLPDYFFEIPASSTGKYHPAYALGDGGLLRHTKAATLFGYILLKNPTIGDKYTSLEKDMMIMSLMLHDGLKSGLPKEKYTRFDHPLLICDLIMDNEEKLGLKVEEIEFICDAIKTHMGVWTTDYNGVEVLEKPKTKYQNFVHMCDYLAAQKEILVSFDENNNISV